MSKINQEEYEILKGLDDKWKWITRDEDSKKSTFPNELWLYEYKPKRMRLDWLGEGGATKRFGYDSLFQFIGDKDSEPYNIVELIREYLHDNQPKLFIDGQEQSFEFIEESEEKEVKKDIEWLKGKVKGEYEYNRAKHNKEGFEGYAHREFVFKYVLGLLDQLDEPEVLSQEFINEKAVEVYADTADAEVHVTFRMQDLENLLVSEQELPVIPKFVAEFIEVRKDTDAYSFQYIFCTALERSEADQFKKEYDWIRKNDELFARAWLDGFTAEEEQRYYVYLGDGQYLVSEDELKEHYAKIRHEEDIGFSNYVLTFTEQEIKDYDERYWPFAVKVEELEENV